MKNICNQNILKFLSFRDIIYICQALSNNIDEQHIIDLCFFSKGDIFPFFPQYIKHNIYFIQVAINYSLQEYAILRYVPMKLCNILWKNTHFTCYNYLKALNYVSSHKGNIPNTFYPMFQDNGFVYVCLRNDGCRLKQLVYHINSKIWVEIAIIQNGNALLYASNQLKNDLDLVKKCVSKFPWAIEYVGNQCINNKDLIQCATKNVKWVARFIKKYAES